MQKYYFMYILKIQHIERSIFIQLLLKDLGLHYASHAASVPPFTFNKQLSRITYGRAKGQREVTLS